MYKIPILFIIFNRKEIALQSFKRIKSIKPQKLYIACDGPREHIKDDIKKICETRNAILSEIDWDCNIKTLFQDQNLGCGKGVYTAINWLFENEERGIILEDDCVAELSFFEYTENLLIKYENDDRVGMIAGFNPIILSNYRYSYIFSNFKSCWGWATWKRSWKNMDIDMNWRNTLFYKSIIANSGYFFKDSDKWKFELKCIDNKDVSAWDWQWYFSLAAQNQLCIYPLENQISNIGNDANATHTGLSKITIPSHPLKFPLVSPEYVVPYEYFDYLRYKRDHSFKSKMSRILPSSVKQKIKKIILKIKKNA